MSKEREIDIDAANPQNPKKPSDASDKQGDPGDPEGVSRPITENEDGVKIFDLSPGSAKTSKVDEGKDVVDYLLTTNQDELLPWETVQLPSLGYFYGDNIPDGKVQVRPTGLTADKILSTQRLVQSGKALDHIFQRYVRLPNNFPPANLLVGDRTFLLFYLRGITHGNMYEFSVECSDESCKAKSFHTYDLNYMADNIKYPQHKQEPIRIPLPYLTAKLGADVWVEARFMRGHDLMTLDKKDKLQERVVGSVRSAKTGRSMSRSNEINRRLEQSMYLLITSINGNTDLGKVHKIISEKMSSNDIQMINSELDRYSPGVDLEVTVDCPECGNEMTMQLPLSESFFRPQASRNLRE